MQFRLIQNPVFQRLTRGSIVGILILVFVMSIFIQTTYAQSRSGPNYSTAACLEPSLSSFIVGPNEITGSGTIYNGCPANVSGSANISARITDCPGVGTSSGGSGFTYNVSPNQAYNQNYDARAGCVVCVNHKPSYFPPFHVQILLTNITGTFQYRGIIYRTGATPSSVSVTDLLGNNPPEVIPSCA